VKILICHQHYLNAGGEDTAFKTEINFLKLQGFEVKSFSVNQSRNKIKLIVEAGLACLGFSLHLKRFKKVTKEFKPDIVRFHNIFPLITTKAFKIAKKTGARTILILHNYRPICINGQRLKQGNLCNKCLIKKSFWPGIFYSCYRGSLIQSILASFAWKLTYYRNDFFFIDEFRCLSEESKKIFSRNKSFPEHKIKVVRNRLDIPELFQDNSSHKKYDFMFIGRLSPEKGVSIFLDLAKKYPEYKFAIIGGGSLVFDVNQMIVNEEIKNTEYLGIANRDKIFNLLTLTKTLIFPSIWEELCPMVILEAYACGVPVISSNFGGQAELVKMISPDLLFDPFNINTFENVISLIKQNEFYSQAVAKTKYISQKINNSWAL
jgi:glycosyltransferase involved in cell wall biosynthesis